MTTQTEQFQLSDGDDILEIEYDGNMYVDPDTGAQYATRGEAMRRVVASYLRACGEDGDLDFYELIDSIDLDAVGQWLDA